MLDDREIIERCRRGQEQWMDLLIDRYRAPLYSLCRRLTRRPMDADDLFQDTWVNVMRGLDGFLLDRDFRTWLFAICVNRYRDQFRRRRRWLQLIARRPAGTHEDEVRGTLSASEPDPATGAVARAVREGVREAIGRLEDDFRVPVVLHYFQHLSMEEIGGVLEIPAGTVKSRLARAREKLRVALEETGNG
jgi:RNA polymerase sigma-70 factor (ECF subfamily)